MALVQSKTDESVISTLSEAMMFGKSFQLIKASNATLTLLDKSGKEIKVVDMMSAYASVNFGHCNPQINPFIEPVADIAACFLPPEAEEYGNWLIKSLGLSDYKLLPQVGGSFAVSTALSLALKKKPGRTIAISGSFHGLGLDALSITDVHKGYALQTSRHQKKLDSEVIHLKPGAIPKSWRGISSLILEPVQGANGYVPLEKRWLQKLVKLAKDNDVTVIADEIQCGFFRHGVLSPAREMGLDADIYLYSKSMTNGMFPLSAVIYRKDFDSLVKLPVVLAHTFQTSAIGFYAALKVAKFIDEGKFKPNMTRIENAFNDFLPALKNISGVKKVFVTGPTLSFEFGSANVKNLVNYCLERGVLVFSGGAKGQRVRVAPPLTIEIDLLKESLDTLLKGLNKIAGK